MFNLAAPTLPLAGSVPADLKLPGANIPAENGGFADILALQGRLEPNPPLPAAAILEAVSAPLGASQAATALPASGNILPVAIAALPAAPLDLAEPGPQLPQQAVTLTLPALSKAQLASIAQPQDEAEPAPPPPQSAALFRAMRVKLAAPEEGRAPAKAARPDDLRVVRGKSDEQPSPEAKKNPLEDAPELSLTTVPAPIAEPQVENSALAAVEPSPLPAPQTVFPQLVVKQDRSAKQLNPVLPVLAAMPQLSTAPVPETPAPVLENSLRLQPRILAALPTAASAQIDEAPVRNIPVRADQPAAAAPIAVAAAEAPLTASLTPAGLRTFQAQAALTADATISRPLAAPIVPATGEPVTVQLARVPGAERPLASAQLADLLAAAREPATPQIAPATALATSARLQPRVQVALENAEQVPVDQSPLSIMPAQADQSAAASEAAAPQPAPLSLLATSARLQPRVQVALENAERAPDDQSPLRIVPAQADLSAAATRPDAARPDAAREAASAQLAPVPVLPTGAPSQLPIQAALAHAEEATVDQSPLRIIPAKADQSAAAMQVATIFTEAEPASNLTPLPLRVPQDRQSLPADAATAQPFAAPIAPVLGEPIMAPIAQVPAAERPVDFTQLVDQLVAAREAASPQPVSLAVQHTDFGKVSLRFDVDGSGINVAMSAADPDFARAVAVAAPTQSANAGSDAMPQSSASEQQSANSQPQSQQQTFSQPKSADPRGAARTQTSNPSPQSSDERSPARRGLFA